MLDDFDELDSSSFLEDLEIEYDDDAAAPPAKRPKSSRRSRNTGSERLVFGMTAMQRFIISILLFGMVGVLGFFFLLVNGSVALPFG